MFNTVEIKEVKKGIGSLVKSIRKNRKLTQNDLANTLNVSRNTIQNLESGKNFTADTLFKILKEFDLLDKFHHEIINAKKEIEQIESLY